MRKFPKMFKNSGPSIAVGLGPIRNINGNGAGKVPFTDHPSGFNSVYDSERTCTQRRPGFFWAYRRRALPTILT